MSCGSQTRASANNTQTALSSLADRQRRRQIPLSRMAGVASRSEQTRQHGQLIDLDDRLLADIGLSRRHAVEEALKSAWIDVLMGWASQ